MEEKLVDCLCQIKIPRCKEPFQRVKKSGDGEDGGEIGRLPVPNQNS